MRRLVGLAAIVLALSACAPQTASLPAGPIPAGPGVRVIAEAVLEGVAPHGNFRFAGGLVLTSSDTSRLHGLSDLVVYPDGRFVSESDEGDLVKGRLRLDAQGRLVGVDQVTVGQLMGEDRQPLSGRKSDSDAEGLALRPNGDMMVSFEGKHRILLYPASGGPPHAVPMPDAPFPPNEGMEALAIAPDAGSDAYLVGREDTRETWICHLSSGCVPGVRPGESSDGSLVSAKALSGGRWAFLMRDFNPLKGGVTSRILITDRAGRTLDEHVIRRPATVDNFEGLAALPHPDGSVRFYLISDDNFSSAQRTLLLAFDWTPPR